MGVKGLWELLAPVGRRVSVETMANKRVAIDASIWIIQFMKAMRDDRGDMLRNAHLLGFFRRCCKLLYLKVKPVFVFDGGTPALKRRTVIARRRQRDKAQTKIRKTAEKLLLNHLKLRHLQDQIAAREHPQGFQSPIPKNPPAKSKQAPAGEAPTADKPNLDTTHPKPDDSPNTTPQIQGPTTNQGTSAQAPVIDLDAAPEGVPKGAESGGEDELEEELEDDDAMVMVPDPDQPLDPAVLASLPASMQLELMQQMREQRVANNRAKFQKVAKAPESFSSLQMEAYLKTVAFRRDLEAVQKAAGQGSTSVVEGVPSMRIASEAAREFVFSTAKDKDRPFGGRSFRRPPSSSRGGTYGRGRGRRGGRKIFPRFQPPARKQWVSSEGTSLGTDHKEKPAWFQRALTVPHWGARPEEENENEPEEDEKLEEPEEDGKEPEEDRNEPEEDKKAEGDYRQERPEEEDLEEDDRDGAEEDRAGKGGPVKVPAELLAGLIVEVPLDESAEPEIDELFPADIFADDGHPDVSREGIADVSMEGNADVSREGNADVSRDGNADVSRDGNADVSREGNADVSSECNADVSRVIEQGEPEEEEDIEWEEGGVEDGLQQPEVEVPSSAGIDSLEQPAIVAKAGDSSDESFPEINSETNEENCVPWTSFLQESPRFGPPELLAIPNKGLSQEEKDLEEAIRRSLKDAGSHRRLPGVIIRQPARSAENEDKGKDKGKQKVVDEAPEDEDEVQVLNDEQTAKPYEESSGNEPLDIPKETLEMPRAAVGSSTPAGSSRAPGPQRIFEIPSVRGASRGGTFRGSVTLQPTAEQTGTSKGFEPNQGQESDLGRSRGLQLADQPGTSKVSESKQTQGSDLGSSRGFHTGEQPVTSRGSEPNQGLGLELGSSRGLQTTEQLRTPKGSGPGLGQGPELERSRGLQTDQELEALICEDEEMQKDLEEERRKFLEAEAAEVARLEEELDEAKRAEKAQQEKEALREEEEQLRAELAEEEAELVEEQRRSERNAESVTGEMFAECQELLQMFGIPYIIAPMEAEAQCAFMDAKGLVDGVVTDDSDVFLFGGQSVYKNIFDSKKYVETYYMRDVESELGLTRNDLVRMALLLGSDYTEGISGIGIVNAIEVVHAFKGLKGLSRFKKWCDSPDLTLLRRVSSKKRSGKSKDSQELEDLFPDDLEGDDTDPEVLKQQRVFFHKHRGLSKNWQLPESFPSEAVVAAYEQPMVDHDEERFEWGRPDLEALKKFCAEKFLWAGDKSDEALLPVLKAFDSHETQLRLDSFFTFSQRFAKFRSKRIQKAVTGITGTRNEEIMDLLPGTERDKQAPSKRRKEAQKTEEGTVLEPNAEQENQAPEGKKRKKAVKGGEGANKVRKNTKRATQKQKAQTREGKKEAKPSVRRSRRQKADVSYKEANAEEDLSHEGQGVQDGGSESEDYQPSEGGSMREGSPNVGESNEQVDHRSFVNEEFSAVQDHVIGEQDELQAAIAFSLGVGARSSEVSHEIPLPEASHGQGIGGVNGSIQIVEGVVSGAEGVAASAPSDYAFGGGFIVEEEDEGPASLQGDRSTEVVDRGEECRRRGKPVGQTDVEAEDARNEEDSELKY